jgi:hypothetical protein
MTNRFKALLVLLVPLCIITACSTTRVAQSWFNPDAQKPTSIIVFGITREESLRRTYEDALSAKLSAEGIPTLPSYNAIETGGEVSPEEAVAAVRRAGADAVLITRLVRLTKELEVVPDISTGPPPWYGGMDPFYSPLWPSYYYNSYRLIEHEAAYIESNLYNANSSALLASILTRTEDPTYSVRQTQELVTTVTEELRRGRFLPRSN